MRCSVSAIVVVWSLATLGWGRSLDASDAASWTAVVVADETPVLSSPGDNAYATDLLTAGTEVEILRRDDGGWLAIRPPTGSFSWLPARKLRRTPDGAGAEVVSDDAVAWIGSRVETVRDHKWLVHLRRGETVRILGSRDLFDSQTGMTETWCQITSPAGEFRWVNQADVRERRRSADPPAARDSTAARQNDDTGDNAIHAAGFFADRAARRRQRGGGTPAIGTAAYTPNAATPPKSATVSERLAASGDNAIEPTQYRTAPAADNRGEARPPSGDVSRGVTDANPNPNIATMSARQFDRELEDVGLQLSLTVTKEPNLWNLSVLRDRTEALVNAGGTPLDRGRARLLLEKIEQFEDLQRRHVGAQRGATTPAPLIVGTEVDATNRTARAPTAETARAGSGVEPRFDGSGWLLPVHSTKRVAPPYALMDDRGQVIQYVSPAPGVNLHRYERKRVGIYGQKGTAASLNAPMITAQRIVDLERFAR